MSKQVICGERIILRPIKESDTYKFLMWRNSENIKHFFLHRTPITYDEHIQWLNNTILTGKALQWIIYDIETQKDIGSVYLRDIDSANRKCQFGILIGETEYQGKGYGYEVTLLVLEYAFNHLKVEKVYLKAVSYNTEAINLYTKVGFKEEGYFRKDIYSDNKPVDVVYMAVFANDFCKNG